MKYQSDSAIKKDAQIFAKATRIERKHFLGARTKEEDWIKDIIITLERTVFPVPLKYFHGKYFHSAAGSKGLVDQ